MNSVFLAKPSKRIVEFVQRKLKPESTAIEGSKWRIQYNAVGSTIINTVMLDDFRIQYDKTDKFANWYDADLDHACWYQMTEKTHIHKCVQLQIFSGECKGDYDIYLGNDFQTITHIEFTGYDAYYKHNIHVVAQWMK